MEINVIVILLIAVVIAGILWWFLRKNRRDQRDMERTINARDTDPEKHKNEKV